VGAKRKRGVVDSAPQTAAAPIDAAAAATAATAAPTAASSATAAGASVIAAEPSRKRKRAPLISLGALVKARLLWSGALLRYTYKSAVCDGVVTSAGTVQWKGSELRTVAQFALAARRSVNPACKSASDGWTSTRVLRHPVGEVSGEPVFVAELIELKEKQIAAVESFALETGARVARDAASAAERDAAQAREAYVEANLLKNPPPPRAPAIKLFDLVVSGLVRSESVLRVVVSPPVAPAGVPAAASAALAIEKTVADTVEIEGEFSFVYRYILRESCSQFDSLPLISLKAPSTPLAVFTGGGITSRRRICFTSPLLAASIPLCRQKSQARGGRVSSCVHLEQRSTAVCGSMW